MPVTARLSSRFYEKLGDEATNDLVNWLNDFDAEFSERVNALNDRNWDRFREQLDSTKTELRAEIRTGLADLRTEMATGFAGLRTELHKELVSQLRWTFAFWVTTLFAIAGLRLL
jgi:gamma-glutamylcysteine synthetase